MLLIEELQVPFGPLLAMVDCLLVGVFRAAEITALGQKHGQISPRSLAVADVGGAPISGFGALPVRRLAVTQQARQALGRARMATNLGTPKRRLCSLCIAQVV